MLIIALVLAVIGLAALVAAVVTSNELIAWVCIGASVIGVLLLVVDAVRERSAGRDAQESDDGDEEATTTSTTTTTSTATAGAEDYPDEPAGTGDNADVAASEKSDEGDGEVGDTATAEAPRRD